MARLEALILWLIVVRNLAWVLIVALYHLDRSARRVAVGAMRHRLRLVR